MESEGIDRLSGLPDAILQSIFVNLTTKEIGRTSVLSRRSRNAWRGTPAMDFTGLKTETSIVNAMNAMEAERVERLKLSAQLRFSTVRSTVQNDDKGASEVEVGKNTIDNLLTLALDGGVEKLYLNVRPNGGMYYTLPSDFFSTGHLRVLHLSNCRIDKIRNTRLDGIESLTLQSLDAENITLSELISACRNVLILKLTSLAKMTEFDVSMDELRQLEIADCAALEYIGVDCGNLQTIVLDLASECLEFIIGDCPYLRTAEVSAGVMLRSDNQKKNLLLGVGQARTLVISCPFRRRIPWNFFGGQQYVNVTRLEVCSSTSAIVAMLALFPHLVELTIRSYGYDNIQGILDDDIGDIPECMKETLTTVTILDFHASGFQMKLAEFLVKNSLVLQHMWLDDAAGKFSVLTNALEHLQSVSVSAQGSIVLR